MITSPERLCILWLRSAEQMAALEAKKAACFDPRCPALCQQTLKPQRYTPRLIRMKTDCEQLPSSVKLVRNKPVRLRCVAARSVLPSLLSPKARSGGESEWPGASKTVSRVQSSKP